MKKTLSLFLFLCLVLSLLSGCGLPAAPAVPAETPAPDGDAHDAEAEILIETPAPVAETESPVQTEPSPALILAQSDPAEAYQAYLALLEQERNDILRYTWQHGYYGYGVQTDEQVPRPVVFCDIRGDGVPEMLYVKGYQTEWDTTLNIVAWENGQLRTLFSDVWDVAVAGGFRYYLYQLRDEPTLYAFTSMGDEDWYYSYVAFPENAGGDLEQTELLREYTWPEYNDAGYGGMHYEYSEAGQPVSEDSYRSREAAILDGTGRILMFSAGCGDFAPAFVAEHGCPAMSCDEAIAWLRGQLGLPEPEPEPFLLSADGLSRSDLDVLKDTVSGVIAYNVSSSWGKAEHLDRSAYVGCYVLSRNDSAGQPRNYVIAVFQNDVTISIPAEKVNKSLSYYYTLRFENVIGTGDSFQPGDYEKPDNKVLAGVPGHNFYYMGYASLSDLYASLVRPFEANYTVSATEDMPVP